MGQVSEKSSRRDTEPSRKLLYTENKTTSRNIMMIMIGENETMLIDPILIWIWITSHLRPLLKLQVRCKNRHLEEFKHGEFLLAFADFCSWKLCAAHWSWSSFWRPSINLTYDFCRNLFPNYKATRLKGSVLQNLPCSTFHFRHCDQVINFQKPVARFTNLRR